MTLASIKSQIATLPPESREEAAYLVDERLGMLCEEREPTEEEIEIVRKQLSL